MLNGFGIDDVTLAFGGGIKMEAVGGNAVFVENADGEAFDLTEQSDSEVIDRIERSKKAGRNLFFEECPPYKPKREEGSYE